MTYYYRLFSTEWNPAYNNVRGVGGKDVDLTTGYFPEIATIPVTDCTPTQIWIGPTSKFLRTVGTTDSSKNKHYADCFFGHTAWFNRHVR
jgi:hypothetical protein